MTQILFSCIPVIGGVQRYVPFAICVLGSLASSVLILIIFIEVVKDNSAASSSSSRPSGVSGLLFSPGSVFEYNTSMTVFGLPFKSSRVALFFSQSILIVLQSTMPSSVAITASDVLYFVPRSKPLFESIWCCFFRILQSFLPNHGRGEWNNKSLTLVACQYIEW